MTVKQEGEAARTVAAEPLRLQKYGELKERLLRTVETLLSFDKLCLFPCYGLREKLIEDRFNLVVVGQFKRGKTCLINALLGENLLPTAVVPLTSIVTVLTYGDTLGITVLFQDGKTLPISRPELADYVTEAGNPRNVKGVKEVLVAYPSPALKDGVRLLDTPGVGSIYRHNTDAAYNILPQCDAALFLLSVDQPVGQAELDFLRDVRQYADRIFFLLNKIDYLPEEEMGQAMSFAAEVLREAMETEVRLFPVSAKLALRGKAEGDPQLLEQSRLPAFAAVLEAFLLREKGQVLLLSAANLLTRLLSQTRLELELERKSLTVPLHELEEKMGLFHARREAIIREKQDFDILLQGEVNRLVTLSLDRDLQIFKGDLAGRLEVQFDSFAEGHRDLALKELSEALEAFVLEEVERAFSAWYSEEEKKIERDFEEICDRFIKRINEMIDELHRFSSELFAVPFEAVDVGEVWIYESRLTFKLKEDLVGLDLLTDRMTQSWPRYISGRLERFKSSVFRWANRVIVGKRRRHMLEAIEMQAGRVRYDFLDRLGKGQRRFHREMVRRLDAAVEGIGAALEHGMLEQEKGLEDVQRCRSLIEERLESTDALRIELSAVRGEAQKM